ncbi:uncharacterized protein LOC108954914 [Eucalyptus grandis]|uniref:uncharacterized protein LOC108954914 n=1 Tax=Eucalyptus grandis TaxID=71139 RepID=UPI00192E98A7|nr:uncharacterized protein LOC108954914 [Eucalyptus grandis]
MREWACQGAASRPDMLSTRDKLSEKTCTCRSVWSTPSFGSSVRASLFVRLLFTHKRASCTARASAIQADGAEICLVKPATRRPASFRQSPATDAFKLELHHEASTFTFSVCGSAVILASSCVLVGSGDFPWKTAELRVFHICHMSAAKRAFDLVSGFESQRMNICSIVSSAWPQIRHIGSGIICLLCKFAFVGRELLHKFQKKTLILVDVGRFHI